MLFFDSVKEALDAGFRPCKVCKPLERIGETPEEIRALLDEIHRLPGLRVTTRGLLERGIQPDALRRWFKKHHGITFHAYQRYVKIGRAVEQLKSGAAVTEVALESYDSLSGFQDSFKQAVGLSPRQSVEQTVILITRLTTPLGLMMAGVVDDRLCLLEFCDRRMLPTELEQLKKLHRGPAIAGYCALFDETQRQLDDYFRRTAYRIHTAAESQGYAVSTGRVAGSCARFPTARRARIASRPSILANPQRCGPWPMPTA